VTVVFTGGYDGLYNMQIDLPCTAAAGIGSPQFVRIDQATSTFFFLWSTAQTCPTADSVFGYTGLSIGWIMIIIFLSVLVAYAVSGVLINKYYRKMEGSELIPNVSFWTEVPSLVKDGIVYTVRTIKSKIEQRRGSSFYQKI